jgi:glucose dehydrogenase
VPRDSDVIPSYARNRKRNMVGNYLNQHRNLNDYEIEDFVLLATVDGTLSARDRKTGKERWQINTEDGAVQTVNHKANPSSVAGVHGGEAAQDDAVTWIVEPTEDGELLLFLSPEGGLEVPFDIVGLSGVMLTTFPIETRNHR